MFTQGIPALRTLLRAGKHHEKRIITVIAMVLIAMGSFVFGMMTQSARATAPLVVAYDGVCAMDGAHAKAKNPADSDSAAQQQKAPERAKDTAMASCKYVGSRNSTKYYPPTCSFAKRIAPKNLRCFSSDDDARAKGYVRSTGC